MSMMRGLLLHPLAWLILFVAVVLGIYIALSILFGTSMLGHRLWIDWGRRRRWRREWPKCDAGWAIDLEPVEENQVIVRWRERETGALREEQMPGAWIPEAWHNELQRAESERRQKARLDRDASERWERLRRTGWKVIRLAEELEADSASGHELIGSRNRVGLLKWMETGLAALQFLAANRQPERQRIALETEVERAERALRSAPETSDRRSLETTLAAQKQRLAHLHERLALIPRVRNDFDCLEANLLLAKEQLEAKRSPVQTESPAIFAPSDLPLVSLDLPLLEQLRQEQQTS